MGGRKGREEDLLTCVRVDESLQQEVWYIEISLPRPPPAHSSSLYHPIFLYIHFSLIGTSLDFPNPTLLAPPSRRSPLRPNHLQHTHKLQPPTDCLSQPPNQPRERPGWHSPPPLPPQPPRRGLKSYPQLLRRQRQQQLQPKRAFCLNPSPQ
jgi:hypothetical protein